MDVDGSMDRWMDGWMGGQPTRRLSQVCFSSLFAYLFSCLRWMVLSSACSVSGRASFTPRLNVRDGSDAHGLQITH